MVTSCFESLAGLRTIHSSVKLSLLIEVRSMMSSWSPAYAADRVTKDLKAFVARCWEILLVFEWFWAVSSSCCSQACAPSWEAEALQALPSFNRSRYAERSNELQAFKVLRHAEPLKRFLHWIDLTCRTIILRTPSSSGCAWLSMISAKKWSLHHLMLSSFEILE